jgi:hypothetical protein
MDYETPENLLKRDPARIDGDVAYSLQLAEFYLAHLRA